jgi:hypothetical protein
VFGHPSSVFHIVPKLFQAPVTLVIKYDEIFHVLAVEGGVLQWQLVPDPPNSPISAPSEFHVFGKLKKISPRPAFSI